MGEGHLDPGGGDRLHRVDMVLTDAEETSNNCTIPRNDQDGITILENGNARRVLIDKGEGEPSGRGYIDDRRDENSKSTRHKIKTRTTNGFESKRSKLLGKSTGSQEHDSSVQEDCDAGYGDRQLELDEVRTSSNCSIGGCERISMVGTGPLPEGNAIFPDGGLFLSVGETVVTSQRTRANRLSQIPIGGGQQIQLERNGNGSDRHSDRDGQRSGVCMQQQDEDAEHRAQREATRVQETDGQQVHQTPDDLGVGRHHGQRQGDRPRQQNEIPVVGLQVEDGCLPVLDPAFWAYVCSYSGPLLRGVNEDDETSGHTVMGRYFALAGRFQSRLVGGQQRPPTKWRRDVRVSPTTDVEQSGDEIKGGENQEDVTDRADSGEQIVVPRVDALQGSKTGNTSTSTTYFDTPRGKIGFNGDPPSLDLDWDSHIDDSRRKRGIRETEISDWRSRWVNGNSGLQAVGRRLIEDCARDGKFPWMLSTIELVNFDNEHYAKGSQKGASQALATFMEVAYGINSLQILKDGDFKVHRIIASKLKPAKPENKSWDMQPIFKYVARVVEEVGDITLVDDTFVVDIVRTLLGTDAGLRNADVAKVPHMKWRTNPPGVALADADAWGLLLFGTKEKILRGDSDQWSRAIWITQNRKNKKPEYRNSTLAVWMQELQRRVDVLIARHQIKKPNDLKPFNLAGQEVMLRYLFMGRSGKSELILKIRTELSGDTISKSRSRVLKDSGIQDSDPSITPRHLRPGCANMLHHLAVIEMEWMTFMDLQNYVRHKEQSVVTRTNYIAARLIKSVWTRWGKLSKKQRKAIKTHTCFIRV